jgi:hypothetical protein
MVARHRLNHDSMADCFCDMDEDVHGSYVTHDDYAELAKERDRLKAEKAELVEALRGLYTLMPEGHANDTRGLWASARAALARAG